MSSFSTPNRARPAFLTAEIPGEPFSRLTTQDIAPSELQADDSQPSVFETREGEFASLRARQHALQKRLTTLQRQQMHENIGRFTRSASPLGLPDSLEMIIYGLREELERVAQQMLSLRRQS